MSQNSPLLELKDIVKSYQVGDSELTVLHGINAKIKAGELVGIIGPSGSGKSTTMNIIGLLDRPTSGQYLIEGRDVSQIDVDERASLRNRTIGFIFQSFFLLPRLTALQNVYLPLTYRDTPKNELKPRAMESLDKVGVAHLADHRPSEMSGGQQQRIAIARALVGKPSLILADEPTGALDSKTSQEVMELLISLNRDDKSTIVIITHDPRIAEQCPHVIEIDDGRIKRDEVKE